MGAMGTDHGLEIRPVQGPGQHPATMNPCIVEHEIKQTVHADPNTCTQLKGIKRFKGSKHQIQAQTPKGQRKNIVPFQTPPGGTVMCPMYEP